METITINTPYIKLDQLLKFANVSHDGAEAKHLIVNGYVSLNGQQEIRRGKKVYPEDEVIVDYEGQKRFIKVVSDVY